MVKNLKRGQFLASNFNEILKIYIKEGVVSEVFEISIHKGSVQCLYPDTISCFSAAWVLAIRKRAALF